MLDGVESLPCPFCGRSVGDIRIIEHLRPSMESNHPIEADGGTDTQDQCKCARVGLLVGLDLRVHSVVCMSSILNMHYMLHGIEMVCVDIQESNCHMIRRDIDGLQSLWKRLGGSDLFLGLNVDGKAFGEVRELRLLSIESQVPLIQSYSQLRASANGFQPI